MKDFLKQFHVTGIESPVTPSRNNTNMRDDCGGVCGDCGGGYCGDGGC